MKRWKSLLRQDATGWLLEDSDPSVRYFALRWLLDKPEDDAEVKKASDAIARSDPVQRIAQRQRPAGYWGADPRPHHGTRGPLGLLLWLGAPKNEAVQKAMDYRMAGCLTEEGGYGISIKGRTVLVPCHGAELLRLMLHYGYGGDPRFQKLLDWLVSVQQPDGVWPCISKVRPFPCLWATADVLRAFDDLPSDRLTPEVREARERAVELFIASNFSRYGRAKPSQDWFRFGYPLQYTSDVLDALEWVAPFVSPDDPRIQEALELVLNKQDRQGRWPCEKHPKSWKWIEQYLPLEELGRPSKWVTLHALRMVKRLGTARSHE